MSAPPISNERTKELLLIANRMFGTIRALTDDGYEAVVIITMMHLRCWLESRVPGASTEQMLDDYKANFILNVESNDAFCSKELN